MVKQKKTVSTPKAKTVDTPPVSKKAFSLNPAYSGASAGRRGRNWVASNAGPSFITLGNMATLRARAHDLIRNDPWIARSAKVYVSNLIGKGIRPVACTPDPDFNRDVMALWSQWNMEADATGNTTFYGLQALATKSIYASGEAIGRRILGADDLSILPLQIQLMEPDFLDHNYTMPAQANGNRIIQGVEMGRYKPEAYHLYKNHPTEFMVSQNLIERVRVPAEDIFHLKLTERIGQIRGVTPLAPVLMKIMDVLEYEEAELVRKKLAAMFVAFVQSVSDDPEILKAILGSDLNANGQEEAEIEPGVLQYLRPGQSITFNQPADVGGSYEPFMRQQHRGMAAGGDVTYEEMTGDLTGVNFSSARVGINTLRRIHEQTQEFAIKPQMCMPVWKWFIKSAIGTGLLKAPSDYLDNPRKYMMVNFVSPAWFSIQPKEEEEAAQMAIRGGTDTRENVAARKGFDVNELDRQQRNDLDRADRLGLTYDTDPRKVSKAGNTNTDQQNNPIDTSKEESQ